MDTASDVALEIFNIEMELRDPDDMHFLLLASKKERLKFLYLRLKKLQAEAVLNDEELWGEINKTEIDEYDNITSGENKELCKFEKSKRTQQKNNRRPKCKP